MERLREYAFQHRGYRGFNTVDRISIAAAALGAVVLLASFPLDSDGIRGLGAFLIILGLLTLVRAFPGEGG